MPSQKNINNLEEAKQKVEKSTAMFFVDYAGLTHQQLEEARRELSGKVQGGTINPRDFRNFGENSMVIGTTALELTREEEKNDFNFIPRIISKDLPDYGIKNLAYHMIRNAVYRNAGNIKPGGHQLRHHPEQLIRVGPIGADFNVDSIPFIQHTPRGRLRDEDINGARGLYNLALGVFRNQGINLKEEGRIITVTGTFDETRYSTQDAQEEEFNEVASMVKNNAAWIRDVFSAGVENGETIVIGAIHEPGTRRLTHIV